MNFRTSISSAVSVVLCSCILTLGCTPSQKETTLQVVTKINNQIPTVVSAADTVSATIAALLPADASLVTAGNVAFDTGARALQVLTASYIANPNATVLAQIQSSINALESQVNTASLNALHIGDPQKQAVTVAALKTLLTGLSIVFGLIMTTEPTAMLDSLRETDTIHLAKMRPYMDENLLQVAARENSINLNAAFRVATAQGF